MYYKLFGVVTGQRSTEVKCLTDFHGKPETKVPSKP